MNVSELYDLTYWVVNNIEEEQIPQKYETLQQLISRNAQPNQQQQPFETQKKDLIEAIKNVPLKQLTKEQLAFLMQLGIAQSVGDEGVEIVDDIFYKNVIDIATTAQKLSDIHRKLTQGLKKLQQIRTGLDNNVIQEEYEIQNEVMIRITFSGDAEISNIVDFKDWGNVWYEIGRGIAIAHNATPEEVKVVGATSGSLIIELITDPAIAATTATIIYSALKLAEKVLDIKKKAKEIKNLDLQNKKLADELAKEAEKEKVMGIEKISVVIIEELEINESREGDKVNALERSIKNLVDFIESGGEIDFVLPEGDEDAEDDDALEYEKLREHIEEMHLLESKLKLLESKLDNNDD